MNSFIKSTIFLSMAITLASCGGGGGGSNSSVNQPSPSVVIATTTTDASPQIGTPLQVTLGGTINLNGLDSTAPDSTISSFHWSLVSKPASSAATILTPESGHSSFAPDVLGQYTLQLKVTNAKGISASENITINVLNTPPATNVVSSVIFSGGITTQPSQNIFTGSIITLDASGSSDADGNPVSLSWELTQQPTDSVAALSIDGKMAHFTPDKLGIYQVRARGTDPAGAYSDVIYTYNANNTPPTSVVIASAVSSIGHNTLNAGTGYNVVLDSTGSSAPNGDTIVKSWLIVSKPAGSLAQLGTTEADSTNFIPDLVGDYVVQLTVHDTVTGLDNQFQTTVQVTASPTATVTSDADPIVLATVPSFLIDRNAPITLRSNSTSPDGSALSYTWKVLSRPSGSLATIAKPKATNITFTPDANGIFVIQLSVTSATGNTTTQNISLNVGNYSPVVILDQKAMTIVKGNSALASAAMSYDQDSPTLSYHWSVDTKPASSSATIANPSSANLTYTPDVPGTYYVTVSVSDGTSTSVGSLTIYVISAVPGTVPLNYAPMQTLYSKSLGKVIITSVNPNALHIVDPQTTSDVQVGLPTSAKTMSLSPDGKLAAVLYEGSVSLIDLNTHTILNSIASGGAQTDVIVNNKGEIYLTGQTGGQWVTPGVTRINGRTGAALPSWNSIGVIYGTTKWIYSDLNNKIFSISRGLSPAQIYSLKIDAASGDIIGNSQSPYWGTYGMADPFWLSGDQSLLFTSAGNYFRTSDLNYMGTFNLSGTLLSMSHSSKLQEAALLVAASGAPTAYPSAYKRFTGSLLFPAVDMPLPLIGNQQPYGRTIFHAANDAHVMVVQTGTSNFNAVGASYYVIQR